VRALLIVLALAAPLKADEDGNPDRPALIQTGGLVLFYSAEGPLSFITMTQRELPAGAQDSGPVAAKTCQYGLSIPVTASWRPTTISGAAGDAGFVRTLNRMKEARPNLAGVYDVIVDRHIVSVLGIFRRECTEVTARSFRIVPKAPEGDRIQ
jgi:hypothetical protein